MPFGLPDSQQKLTYGGYLRVRELTALQELKSDPAQHDETLFIIIHQTYELWFKQILHEVDAIVGCLDRDEILAGTRLLRRCHEIQRVLISQLTVLETMTPMDFLSFRDHLMPASGFQSSQFREIEFLSGLKEERFLSNYEPGSPEHGQLSRRLAQPTLRDAFHALLRRRGFDAPADAAPGDERIVATLVALYREPTPHYDLFLLAEALTEYDELFSHWRFRHVQMVERVIGGRPGTGGSDGAAYLRGTVGRRLFPELWEMRTRLGGA
ncbi:MAG TPA: tryptophan 2,3-dioxygenase family protein [Gemmatimonadales bacterium]|jgi:tryptophan 2,3-dioxygenase|nr:tryptophan 2,3-dioxygenase family protein [Gemmatimonadales bacterium]